MKVEEFVRNIARLEGALPDGWVRCEGCRYIHFSSESKDGLCGKCQKIRVK